jgi:hypothetical protein
VGVGGTLLAQALFVRYALLAVEGSGKRADADAATDVKSVDAATEGDAGEGKGGSGQELLQAESDECKASLSSKHGAATRNGGGDASSESRGGGDGGSGEESKQHRGWLVLVWGSTAPTPPAGMHQPILNRFRVKG